MLAAIACPSAADAKDAVHRIDIVAASLPEALAELSREAGVSIGTEGILPHARVPQVHGRMTVGEALARLLANSGFAARQVGGTAWRIERAPPRTRLPSQSHVKYPSEVYPELAEPIIVVAAKRNRSLEDLPMALAVVQLDDIRRHDPGSATAGVAGDIEGLSLTALGPGRNRMFLRGIADSPFNGESQATVAVMLDDARLTYSAPDPDIRLVDVERVEVLKGPQGSLYGTGALGGIYQIVTRRPDLDQASLDLSVGAGTVAHGRTGASGSAIANLPLVQGGAALRLVGYAAEEPGWIDTGPRSDSNSNRLLGTRAALGIDAGDRWRVDLTGFAQWLEVRDSSYVYQPHAHVRPAQLPEPHDNDLRHIAVRAARPAEQFNLLLSSAVTWHEVEDTLDATQGAAGLGLSDPRLFEDKRHYRVWDSEARIDGRFGTLDWLVGLSHVEARQILRAKLSGSLSADQLPINDDRRATSDSAAFGEVTVPVVSGLKLAAGARLYHSVVKETHLLTTRVVSSEQRRSGLTPSASLSWRPRHGRLIYLRYGSAFRQGGVDFSPAGQVENLRGDELATIEFGWRESLPGGGRLELDTYHTWWKNVQSDLLEPNGLIETANVGNARIVGAELSLDQPIGRDWRVQAGVTLNDARLVRSTSGLVLDDRHLPIVPRYTLRAAVGRDFRLGESAASIKLQLRYLGPARLSFDPALDRPMGRTFDSRLEGHITLDSMEVGLSIENVLDWSADTFAYGNSLRFADMRQYTPQRPLTASLSLLRRF